ncbi:DNA recombination protein RmuC [Shewanella sp. VB17]|uniref:DNA recombination protein RmuC n=1 Tax=Shewanella sp. VB17 TaxID=2739432 RepID=UPI0015638F8D|nr:DNA recombination protein RmuC [Shewanella sp. VB17]NRD73885.1 DNA recombination protein RmuC [Shewanella sp. VB17]
MPNDIMLSVPEIITLTAISFLSIMIGALLNQKFTRRRWEISTEQKENIHQQDIEQHKQNLRHKNSILSEKEQLLEQVQYKLEQQLSALGKAQADAERCAGLEAQLKEIQRKLMESQLALSKSNAMQQNLTVKFNAEQQALEDKLQLLETAEIRLHTQFENLANKIFEERSEKFQHQNTNQLDSVLGPFKQQLEGFRKQVSESYTNEQSQRSAFNHQLESLKALNMQMSQDAINLTNALKGDNKQQGNWGEVILERVLQESGLREGHEYDTQTDFKNDEGKHFKPDVIVHLPENKDVVVDAKMSLVAYERYFNSDDSVIQKQAVKEHVISVRSHIKGLSNKNYQKLHGVTSLDYVLMFIPLEPAFLLALEHDPSLINYALEHNIMIVSPTNLLVALRTINNIWRYEYQNQNAQEIAKQAGKIYDKLCGYIEDMEKLGRAIEGAEKSYANAMNKLSKGKGNLVKQAHQMQQLGVNTSKQLDQRMLEQALGDYQLDDKQLN